MQPTNKQVPVFKSTSPGGGRLHTQTAINWRRIEPVDHGLLPQIFASWRQNKSELDYASYDSVARTLDIKGNLSAKVQTIAENLKALWMADPEAFLMTIDRMGENVAFKIKKPAAFAQYKPIKR